MSSSAPTTPRARPAAGPSRPSPARRVVSFSLAQASRAPRDFFAAFTPRRSSASPRPRQEVDHFAALPVLLSGPAQAYVLAAEEDKARARTMSVWSADSVELGLKGNGKRPPHVKNRSCTCFLFFGDELGS